MLIESTKRTIRFRMRSGEEVKLNPGVPIELPDSAAQHLIRQAKGLVRKVVNLESDWLTLWRQVAEISSGLEPTDPRLPNVMQAINICDAAFIAGSKPSFLVGVDAVAQAMNGGPCGIAGHE